ncbi:MAG: aspartate/glutamate racemase family protein [Anaerolineae bacterium]|nr:aspartate/glutamate racemase family protein [Anaerolineae bacterium]
MKTIGLIGGMSWESSIEYYRLINEGARRRLGGLHSARSVMVSLDFAELEVLQRSGRWDEAGDMLVGGARQVEAAGADMLLICSNTMHCVAPQVEAAIHVPLLHIADATAQRIADHGLECIGLLGTRFTMEEGFYRGRLVERHGLQVLIPPEPARAGIHRVIYEELVVGRIEPSSKAAYLEVMDDLVARGAQGIILGCTEIGLLVSQEDTSVPVFDTTRIHAEAAVELALALH